MYNITLQNQLKEAIKKHRIIRLKYKNQYYHRTFEPYVIYYSPADPQRILLGGYQTKNDSKPFEQPTPHKFEVDFISSVVITDDAFDYDVRFDVTDNEYRNGIILVIKRIKVTE